jgi:hypothetical protein
LHHGHSEAALNGALLRDFSLAMPKDIAAKIMFAEYVDGNKANQVSGTLGSGRAKTMGRIGSASGEAF